MSIKSFTELCRDKSAVLASFIISNSLLQPCLFFFFLGLYYKKLFYLIAVYVLEVVAAVSQVF